MTDDFSPALIFMVGCFACVLAAFILLAITLIEKSSKGMAAQFDHAHIWRVYQLDDQTDAWVCRYPECGLALKSRKAEDDYTIASD